MHWRQELFCARVSWCQEMFIPNSNACWDSKSFFIGWKTTQQEFSLAYVATVMERELCRTRRIAKLTQSMKRCQIEHNRSTKSTKPHKRSARQRRLTWSGMLTSRSGRVKRSFVNMREPPSWAKTWIGRPVYENNGAYCLSVKCTEITPKHSQTLSIWYQRWVGVNAIADFRFKLYVQQAISIAANSYWEFSIWFRQNWHWNTHKNFRLLAKKVFQHFDRFWKRTIWFPEHVHPF